MTRSRRAAGPCLAPLDEARRAPVSPDELAAFRGGRLAACEYPRLVEILPDLPRTASGKILRRELRSRSRENQ